MARPGGYDPCREHDATAGFEYFWEHLGSAFTDQPMAVFRYADGNCFVFVRIQSANNGGGGNQRNFMFAGAPSEEHAYAQQFLFVWGHEPILSDWGRGEIIRF